MACSIYIMVNTVLGHYRDNPDIGDKFNETVFMIFLKDFNENPQTLMEYERDNPVMGKGQVIWALGKTVCDALGVKSANLAIKVSLLFEKINRIEMNTTPLLLTMPLEKVRIMVKSIAIQHPGEYWLSNE